EFVLEGTVAPTLRLDEGPFGEFTGVSTGVTRRPIFTVQTLTCRKNPVFQDVVSGCMEHLLLPTIGMEHYFLTVARRAVPRIKALKLSSPLTVCVALEKEDDSEPARIIEALLASDIYVKYVVVVDADVDTSDLRQIAAAITLYTRPDRDIFVKHRMLGTELDPSHDPVDAETTKAGIDATLPLGTTVRVKKNKIPEKILDSINLSELLEHSSTHSSDRDEEGIAVAREPL